MTKVMHVGIDVDDSFLHLAGVSEEGELFEAQVRPNDSKLIECLRKWETQGFEIKACYEATYLGFALCRAIRRAGFACEVIASSLIPEQKGRRVKTDRTDCRKLAWYYMQGLLTPIYVPDEKDEAMRDLVRSRDFVVNQSKRSKQYLIALMRRYALDYKKTALGSEYWTKRHREWIKEQIRECEIEWLRMNLQMLLGSLEHMESLIALYNEKIQAYAELPQYASKVRSLICYRGLDIIGAMTLATEIGDIRRFTHPRSLMSYMGFDISEYSSGGKERKYHITKLGNRHLRTTLVEACQSVRKPCLVGRALRARRKKSTLEQIAIADRCMRRLYVKSNRLLNREKPSGKVKVACAREMAGFIWESLSAVS